MRLVDIKPGKLIFSWTPIARRCSSMYYEIQSNCGECPTATNSTVATCIVNNLQARLCTFTVRSVVCDNIVGSWSNEIEVMLKGTPSTQNLQILHNH